MAIATDSMGEHALSRAASSRLLQSQDRARAFRHARRHTMVVRTLRIALPVIAVALLGSYGLFLRKTWNVGGGQLTVGPVELSTRFLTMHTPRYEGYNADGGHYVVTSKTAVQDVVDNTPIKLFDIDGKLAEPNDSHMTLTATRGEYDNKASQLELMERIDVKSSTGMTARLTRATVFMKEGRITSDEPVAVDMPAGTLRANAMVMLQKTHEVTFSNGVAALLTPPAKDGQVKDGQVKGGQPKDGQAKPAPVGPQGATPAQPRSVLFGASNEPVNIVAPTLKIDDVKKSALFSGDVRAVQGTAVLTSRELEALYEGSPAGQSSQPNQSSQSSPGSDASRIKKLLARENVVITRGDDRVTSPSAIYDAETEVSTLTGGVSVTSSPERQATGDQAVMDNKSDTTLLTGNVVVQQAKNVLKGQRLFVDQRNGTSLLTSPAEAATPAGRITARFYQTETKTKTPSPRGTTSDDNGAFTFQTDPNAPVDVDADLLEVNDKEKTATFRGDVFARQADFTIRTAELIVAYTGQAGLAVPAQADNGAKAPTQLQRIYTRKKVVVNSKTDQSATGDWGEFDVKANTMVLGGEVFLTRARNVVRGPKLVIDMVTGQSRMETGRVSPPSTASAAPAPAANAAPADGQKDPPGQIPNIMQGTTATACGGRMCALFYPKDAKRGAADALQGAAKERPEVPKRKQETSPADSVSSWSSETRPKAD